MFPQYLGQLACINACDARHLLSLEPVSQSLHSVPVAELTAVITHDNGTHVYLLALHESGKSILFECEGWHSIVANQREGECHQLSGIGGVGQTLGITHHSGIEHHLSCHRFLVTERSAMKLRSVFQSQCNLSVHLFL